MNKKVAEKMIEEIESHIGQNLGNYCRSSKYIKEMVKGRVPYRTKESKKGCHTDYYEVPKKDVMLAILYNKEGEWYPIIGNRAFFEYLAYPNITTSPKNGAGDFSNPMPRPQIWVKERGNNVPLHKLFMEWKLKRKLVCGEQVDHINHNRFDVTEENLRLVTNRQNQQNRIDVRSNSVEYGYKADEDFRYVTPLLVLYKAFGYISKERLINVTKKVNGLCV